MWAIFWSGQFYQWSFEIAIDLKGFCSKTLWLFYSNDCIAFCVCERYITKWLGCSSSLCYVCAASFFSTSVKDTTKMISKRSGKTEIFANETRKKWKTNTSTLICIFRIHIHLEIRAKHERRKNSIHTTTTTIQIETNEKENICHGLIDSHSYSIDVKQLDIREDQKTEISLGR